MVEREYDPLDEQVTEILDRHSAGLLDGDDRGENLVLESGEDFPALVGLVEVARRLRETLIPVRPDESFVADLRMRLMSMDEKEVQVVSVWSRLRTRLSRHSTVLGAAISILALLAMAVRLVGSLVMVIVLLSGNRRRRTAAA